MTGLRKKILVTGANGFLGSHIVRSLFRDDYDVRIMVRSSANLESIADVPCETYFGDITCKEDVKRAVQGCEFVVHAAAVTDQWGIPYETYEQINFLATKHIAEACLEFNIVKLIFISTANTMSPGDLEQPGTELGGFTLFKSNSPYIITKYLAQQYLLEQAQKTELPVIILNPTFIIGPMAFHRSSGQIFDFADKRILFYPPGGKNFVYVKDVCSAVINAIDYGIKGECYLVAGENMSYRQFFSLVKSSKEKSQFLVKIPVIVLRCLGLLGTVCEKIIRKSFRINSSNAYLLCIKNYYSGKKSQRELRMNYTPITVAVRETIDWQKENTLHHA